MTSSCGNRNWNSALPRLECGQANRRGDVAIAAGEQLEPRRVVLQGDAGRKHHPLDDRRPFAKGLIIPLPLMRTAFVSTVSSNDAMATQGAHA